MAKPFHPAAPRLQQAVSCSRRAGPIQTGKPPLGAYRPEGKNRRVAPMQWHHSLQVAPPKESRLQRLTPPSKTAQNHRCWQKVFD